MSSGMPTDAPAAGHSHERILRYTFAERVMHWIAGLSYVYLLMTGAGFLVSLSFLACRSHWRRTYSAFLASVGGVGLVCRHALDVRGLARGHARD